jgi:hypothetical protein
MRETSLLVNDRAPSSLSERVFFVLNISPRQRFKLDGH